MPRRSIPLLFALLIAGAVDVSATTMVASSLEKLLAGSESVVHATTVATRSEWDAHRRILTVATVRVLEDWHGSAAPGSEIEIASFGGVKDGIAMKVPGAPRFTPGEEVVLFLGRAPNGALGVVDMAQGKFEITRAEDGGSTLNRRDLAEVEWVGGEAESVLSLSSLHERVSELSRRLRRTGGLQGGAR